MLFGKYVNRFYIKYFWHFFLGVLLLVFVDVIQLYVPELVGNLTKLYDAGQLTSVDIDKAGLTILLIAFGMFVGRFAWRVAILSGAYKISTDLRQDMFDHSLNLSQRFYHNNKVGAIMSYYTNDIDTIQECFGWGTVMLVDAVFLSGLTIFKMFKLNWQLTLISIVPLLILCTSFYFIDVKMEEVYAKRQKAFEKMSDYTQEIFTGLRVIKAFAREKIESALFKKVNENSKNKDLDLVKFSALLEALIHILVKLMIVIGMSIGGYFIIMNLNDAGFVNISRDELISFILYFDNIVWPMMALGQIVSLVSRAKTSLKRVSKFLDEKVEIVDNEVVDKDSINGKITIKNLSYSYPDSDEVLKGISLEINPGENIGIVGKVGSGKTTLANILLRLDNIEQDKVFLDDIDIMKLPIKLVRDSIGYVPQDNFLFSSTIKENISFSKGELNNEEVISAAKFADVDDNIQTFTMGYDTLLGERGVTFSGGQKQRISIARAYLKDAPIMILDDSVSAVDIKTEETILRNIKEKRQGKTTIIIASRVSTVRHLDRIIVLNNGSIEAFDSHDNLMKISPTYAKMVYLQQLEKEADFDENEK